MNIMTIVGTRPEIIRLSLIIARLDRYADRHVLVHTGQNFTDSLSGVFFRELGIRKPDIILSRQQRSFGGQIAVMFEKLERLLEAERRIACSYSAIRTAPCRRSLRSAWASRWRIWKRATAAST